MYLLARYEQIWRPTAVATVPRYYRTGSFLSWTVKTETTVQKDYHLLSIFYIGDNACKKHYVSTSKRLFGSHGTNMLGASTQAVLQSNPNAGETNATENYVELYIYFYLNGQRSALKVPCLENHKTAMHVILGMDWKDKSALNQRVDVLYNVTMVRMI